MHQIEFRLSFTYKHSSTHTSVVVNRSSIMRAPMRLSLSFSKNQMRLIFAQVWLSN